MLNTPHEGKALPVSNASRFFCLILTGTQGRAIVRRIHTGTVEEVDRNLRRYFAAIDVDRFDREAPLPQFRLLKSMVLNGELDRLPAELATDLWLAALFALPLPRSFLSAVVTRIRVEQQDLRTGRRKLSPERAALLQFYFVSHGQAISTGEEISRTEETMKKGLDVDSTERAYVFGRVLAVSERMQSLATPNLNRTVVDRFYSMASVRPGVVLTELFKLYGYHLNKAKREIPGVAIKIDREFGALMSLLSPDELKTPLNLEEQGRFGLGYYHQRQSFYPKPSTAESIDNANVHPRGDRRMTRPELTQDTVLEKRYEIVLLFDVRHGNPNGDPDADNAPRTDPETGTGLVTDVAIKRKIRNYVGLTREFAAPNNIFVKERGILANEQREAYKALGVEPDGKSIDKARDWMCRNYFDIRTFGAVMTTGKADVEDDAAINAGKKTKGKAKLWNCGQVRGPVQLGFATSIDPITSIPHTITRVALTNPGDAGGEAVVDEAGTERAASGQMGRKHGVAYGLYRMHGFISPFLATQTGFTGKDLGTLVEAMTNLFDHDRSATRGEMAVRGLWLFEHKDKLGNAPAHKVLATVQVTSVPNARSFAEYEAAGITEPADGTEALPGVTVWRYV